MALLSLLSTDRSAAASARAMGDDKTKARLKRDSFEDATCVPFGAEHRIDRTPPLALTGRVVDVREGSKRLEVDLEGDHRFTKKVTTKKPAVIDVPGENEAQSRSLLVYWRRGAWYACSASSLVGRIRGQRVVLLDADLDGAFIAEGDYVRVGDGSPVRCDGRGLITLDGVLHTMSLDLSGRSPELHLDQISRPEGVSKEQWLALAATNRFRTNTGLPPETLNAERSAACQLHAEYLYLNNYDYSKPWDGVGSHEEIEGNPGYTAQGREAAHNSVDGGSGDIAESIAAMSRSMLHRVAFLGPAREGLGVGAVSKSKNPSANGYSVIWTVAWHIQGDLAPVVVPAPGQSGVELFGQRERPAPISPARFYDRQRGYPISVSYGERQLSDVDLKLFALQGRREHPVEGFLFTPESPVHATRPKNQQSAFFMPAAPLKSGQRYVALFSARENGELVELDWSFTTGK